MTLSRDVAAYSGREPAAGEARDEGEIGGRYLPDLGDTTNTGNTSIVSRSKSQRTLLGDSCTDDCDTCYPCGLSIANWLTSGSISNSTTGKSSDTGDSTTTHSTLSVDTGDSRGLSGRIGS